MATKTLLSIGIGIAVGLLSLRRLDSKINLLTLESFFHYSKFVQFIKFKHFYARLSLYVW